MNEFPTANQVYSWMRVDKNVRCQISLKIVDHVTVWGLEPNKDGRQVIDGEREQWVR